MMKIIVCIFLFEQLMAVAFASRAPVVLSGPCPKEIPTVPNFNPDSFLGDWYEIKTYPSPITGQCTVFNYKKTSGSYFDITWRIILDNKGPTTLSANNTVWLDDGRVSKYFATYLNPETNEPIPNTYTILDTDYENYSVIYSCIDREPNQREAYGWVFSRQDTLSEESERRVRDVIASFPDLKEENFIKTEHSDEVCKNVA